MSTRTSASTDIYVRNAWYVAGLSEEFEPEELNQRVITEKAIVVWRARAGEVVAFDDRCCHKRMPMSAGRFIEDGLLECAYHGLCFNSAGQCVRIPSQPGLPIPSRARLRRFPVIEQDGVVWLWPGDPDRVGDVRPPPTPELVDPAWEHISGTMEVAANSVLMVENLLDVSHFYPLHASNIGKAESSTVPMQLETGQINGCNFVRSSRTAHNYDQSTDFCDMLGYAVADSYSAQTMVGPGIVLAERALWPPGKIGDNASRRALMNYHMMTPIHRGAHVYRWVVNMPAGQMSGRFPSVKSLERAREILSSVFAQDIWALERQQKACERPDEGFEEMFLKTDSAVSRGRQVLYAMQEADRSSSTAAPR
jgi:phenylpropionate dioxygenase-like ring-hydroxylating dioxygenase large terminal subunit